MSSRDEPAVLLPCACCGSLEIGEPGAYEICKMCGWEDDPVQFSRHDFRGGANKMSLNEAKIAWQNKPSRVRGSDNETVLN